MDLIAHAGIDSQAFRELGQVSRFQFTSVPDFGTASGPAHHLVSGYLVFGYPPMILRLLVSEIR